MALLELAGDVSDASAARELAVSERQVSDGVASWTDGVSAGRLSHATRQAGCNRYHRCHRSDAQPPDPQAGERRSRGRVWRRSVLPMPETMVC